jgi:hypothetical protein
MPNELNDLLEVVELGRRSVPRRICLPRIPPDEVLGRHLVFANRVGLSEGDGVLFRAGRRDELRQVIQIAGELLGVVGVNLLASRLSPGHWLSS